MIEVPFVRRQFEVDGKTVEARFYKPVADRGDYRCDLEIEWPEKTRSKHAFGVDEVQALLLAMQLAHTDLLAAREMDGRQVSYLNDRNLGLPLAKSIVDWDPENRL